MKTIRLSGSVRLILAVFNLRASITENWGQAILDILSKQYPNMLEEMAEDERYKENPAATIGYRMLMKAKREVQNNETDAFDAVQDFLRYLIESDYDFRPRKRKDGKTSGADTWRRALNNIMSNIRARAMSHSFRKFDRGQTTDSELYAHLLYKKREVDNKSGRYKWTEDDENTLQALREKLERAGKDPDEIEPLKMRRKNTRRQTIDEAFGTRPEGGDAPEGGESRIPSGQVSWVPAPGRKKSKEPGFMPVPGGEETRTDDRAAMRSFLDTLDEIIPDLKREIAQKGYAEEKFFDFIMNDEGGDQTGTFMPSIDSNMNQGSAFRDYLEDIANSDSVEAAKAREVLTKKGKGWSGFVNRTRAKLLKAIVDFTESYLTEDEYQELWDAMYGVMTPARMEKLQESKYAPATGAPEERAKSLGNVLDKMAQIKKLESRIGDLNKRAKKPGLPKAERDAVEVSVNNLRDRLKSMREELNRTIERVKVDLRRQNLSYDEELKKEIARRESAMEQGETIGASQRRKDLRKVLRLRAEHAEGIISPEDDDSLMNLEARLRREMKEEEKDLEEELKKEEKKLKSVRTFADELKRLVYMQERQRLNLLNQSEMKEMTNLQQRLLRNLRAQGLSMRAELFKAHKEHFAEARRLAEEEMMAELRARDIAEEAIRDVDDAKKVWRTLQGLPPEEEPPAPKPKKPFPPRETRERLDILEEGIPEAETRSLESLPLRTTIEEQMKAREAPEVAPAPSPSAPSAPKPKKPTTPGYPWQQPIPTPPPIRPPSSEEDVMEELEQMKKSEPLSPEEMAKLPLPERLKLRGLMGSVVERVYRSISI